VTALANPELETLLLALILRNNKAADHLGRLRIEDLCDPVRQAVLENMLALRNEGRPINQVTLGSMIASDPLGGPNLLDALKAVEFGQSPPESHDVAAALIDLSVRRQVIALAEQMASRAGDPKAKAPDIIGAFLNEFDHLLARSNSKETLSSIAEAVDRATERWQTPNDGRTISTGITDLDAVLGGYDPGNLIVLAGRPSMGKTACGLYSGLQAAKLGHGVLIFSLEMQEEHCVARMAAAESGIPYKNAVRKQLPDAQLEKFIRAAMSISKLPIMIDDAAGQTVAQIAAKVRRTANEFERRGQRLSLVIIDHLTKLRFDSRYSGSRHLEIGEATTRLAGLAKDHDIAVLLLSQLNRQVESRENKRPQLSDLRESGAIEEDADVVIFPFREAYYLERTKCQDPEEEAFRRNQLKTLTNALELQVAKCRNGETATVEVFADMPTNRLGNLDRRH
jgi:replicative DNA helicase